MPDAFRPIPAPTADRDVEPTGVSANGDIVAGYTQKEYDAPLPVTWSARTGALRTLATFGGPEGAATGISGDGRIVAGNATTRAMRTEFQVPSGRRTVPVRRPCLWRATSSAPIDLETLARDPATRRALGSDQVRLMGVSADGDTFLGTIDGTAFVWSRRGRLRRLGPLPGHTFSAPLGINADGTAVIGISRQVYGDLVNDSQTFLWSGSGIKPWPPGPSAESCVISADGKVLATERGVWDHGKRRADFGRIALPPSIREINDVTGLSDDGAVAVGNLIAHEHAGAGIYALNRPFLWTRTKGLRELIPLLKGRVALGGWTLQKAVCISADGTTLVGTGSDVSGRIGAWHLRIGAGLASL